MEKEWLTEDEAAKWLSVSLETIQEAIRTGQLPVLHLGSQIRINRDIILKLASRNRFPLLPVEIDPSNDDDNCIPIPRGMKWIDKLVSHPFQEELPKKKDQPDKVVDYSPGWQGKISLQGKEYTVRAGQTTDRNGEKLAVFLNGVHLCGFSKTLDGQGWASIIKPDGKHTLGVDETPPALYRDTKIGSYRDSTGMTGSGVPHAAAVIITKDDMVSAIHHAVTRWLGRNHLLLEPAS